MNFNVAPIQPGSEEMNKHITVLDTDTYQHICDFINSYGGLTIDCIIKLEQKFPNIKRLTLKSILEKETIRRLRAQPYHYDPNAAQYSAKYEEQSKQRPKDTTILLNMAIKEKLGPVMLCRTLLKYKYNLSNKRAMLSEMIRYPQLINDPLLSANVSQCLCSDSQDGPLVDLRRRVLGEEYEVKLKRMAKEADMHFYDEKDLRHLGYDKTPDIKMILPFLYKGNVINWIESKAQFGDIETHKLNIKQQLTSYCNRFGAGIVIYWFGYQECTPTLPENSIGIIVLYDFPLQTYTKLLDL